MIVVPAAIAMCDLMLRSRLRADESKRDQTMDEDITSDAELRKPDSHIAEAIPALPEDHPSRVMTERNRAPDVAALRRLVGWESWNWAPLDRALWGRMIHFLM